MGGRWTTYSYFPLLILVLTQGCSSLNLDGLALLRFQERVSDDPYGAFTSWDVDDHDPCSWSHVHCVFGHVQTLDLKGLSLEGVLTPDLGNLTHLRRLVLSHNHFSGVIPKELGELKMLEVLDLRDNNLIGNIPPEIGKMQSLKILLLYNNNLEGTIPPEHDIVSFLCKLQFDDNLTFGVIDAVGNLNRKLGRCIWQGGSNHLRNADSLLSPIKETVINYLKPFQQFSKGILDNSCVNEESPITPEVFQDDGIIINRKLAEEPSNLAAASSSSDGSTKDYILPLPSTRSSGSFPAVRQGKKKLSIRPSIFAATPTATSSGQYLDTKNNSELLTTLSCGAFLLITAIAVVFICRIPALKTLGPWRPGLSKQLQKAFVTGIPKLDRTELEAACEDYSNIIETMEGCTLFKGTLSSGVEICVASTTITRLKDWSKHAELSFHDKIDSLSHLNHKNFVNLLGYCEEDEPFVRMMVFEYAPNGSLSDNLHGEILENLDWSSRMRIIMGVAYCLQCMHELSPPMVQRHLNSKMIYLTDDYAAKVADMSFWKEFYPKEKAPESKRTPKETNIYSFGVLLLEILSGKHPYSEPLVTWAEQCLGDKEKRKKHMIDPSLNWLKQEEVDVLCEVIQDCIQMDASQRPTINEIVPKLRQVLQISPQQATPRLSPLWWAELEILGEEGT